MNQYIAFLRGINVGGKRLIKMQDLIKLFASLNYDSIRTYLQSGNVVFKSKETDLLALLSTLENAIFEYFKFEVKVILRRTSDLKVLLESNPYLLENDMDTSNFYVTFLETIPDSFLVKNLNLDFRIPDTFKIIGKEVFIHITKGYGNTKINNSFFENKLHLSATTRNWKTVNELYTMTLSEN